MGNSPDFAEAFTRAAKVVERHGLRVSITDVLDPNTGDLDGQTILIDYLLSAEDRLFLLVHLFGHSVQWNTSPDARTVGQASYAPVRQEEFDAVHQYEHDASRYGLAMLYEAGVQDLDRWLTDQCHADWRYLEHFYRTGEKKDPKSFQDPGTAPILTPLSIPTFTPTVWPKRYAI